MLWSASWEVHESVRELSDRMGGGLMIAHRRSSKIELELKPSRSPDILEVQGCIYKTRISILLVYFATGRKKVDSDRNRKIRLEVEEKLGSVSEDSCVILLGDFNGHIGFLGDQEIDVNGRMILEWLGQFSLTLLNCDDRCEGKYTWQNANQRSCIDFIMTNGNTYDKFRYMEIDENKLEIDVSDHNLISVHLQFECGDEGRRGSGGKPDNIYFMTNETALREYIKDMCNKFKNRNIENITSLDREITDSAERHLKRRYRNKGGVKQEKRDQPWMNALIKKLRRESA